MTANVWPCAGTCGRMLRKKGLTVEDYPGTVALVSHNMCSVCKLDKTKATNPVPKEPAPVLTEAQIVERDARNLENLLAYFASRRPYRRMLGQTEFPPFNSIANPNGRRAQAKARGQKWAKPTDPEKAIRNQRQKEYRARRKDPNYKLRTLSPCGTEPAYKRHLDKGETACDPCKKGHAEYAREGAAKRKAARKASR